MKVVADSHSIWGYLAQPELPSGPALAALGEAGDTDGVVVSAWTIPELSDERRHKRGDRSVARSSYELVRATLVDPTTTRTVEPFGAAMGPHLEAAALVLPDPFDWTGLDGAERAGTVLVRAPGADNPPCTWR